MTIELYTYIFVFTLTCGCLGFVVGVNLAGPVKRFLAEQLHAEMKAHLEAIRKQEEKENEQRRGFAINATASGFNTNTN